MTVTLSICIPTYNRSECLKDCLNSVLASVAGHERDIEIVISDNASTDDTASIIRSFQITYPWIRYHRNEENIGGDPNIYLVSTMGLGEYIWIFGDDDKMEKDAVATVIKQIDAGYNLIICNYSVWAKDFSYIKKINGLRLTHDEVYDNPDELMKHIGYHMGYISTIITKREIYFKIPVSEYLYYMDYSFPQIYAVYSGVSEQCKAICNSSTLVFNRSDNHGDVNWRKAYVIGMAIIFENLSYKGYSKKAIASAKHGILLNILVPSIIGYKLINKDFPSDIYNLMFQHYKSNWFFWAAALPALLIPSSMFRLARKAKKLIKP